MLVPHDDFFHLTYCTNIHAGESWDEVFAQLDAHVPKLKQQLSPKNAFGVGLRLSNEAAIMLQQHERIRAFQEWLDEHDCYVFTLNGFPYGSFHGEVVKDRVYAPDWRTWERVEYTRQLAHVLAALLPEGMEGSISTSPISYKPWLDGNEREEAFRQGAEHLAEVAAQLVRIEEKTGKRIHLGLEPEPDCLIENTEETIAFFQDWLFPTGAPPLAEELECSLEEAETHLREYVRVCYDTCHFAVEYETPRDTLHRFEEAGIELSKVQLSAALKISLLERSPEEVVESLEPFAESTYLHQVVERHPDGALSHHPDLPVALDHLNQSQAEEWRIHYHVPLFVDRYGSLRSTQDELLDALHLIRESQLCSHLEIETYTWEVLPKALQRDLNTSIRREFEWILSHFQ